MATPRSYRIMPHTADLAVEARGADLAEAMANAARAMFSVMVDLRTVRVREWVEVEVASDSPEDLLVEWLNELLFRWETTRLVLRRFQPLEVAEDGGTYRLRMRCGGERFDDSRHEPKADVKAATYHSASVRRTEEGWTVYAVLDL